ncbi:MAG: PIN domain-containing protein [Pseudomonadota bacterium]|nr:PIN domain-containing protein [Pseudomonadota bacterium]
MREYILVDFENVQPATLAGFPSGDCEVLLFLGEKQAKVSVELIQALKQGGYDYELISIAGSGPNAVDFHIAYTIGRLAQAHPGSAFTILSRDTGFDPLVRYLAKAGVKCQRVPVLDGKAVKRKVSPAKKAARKAAVKPELDGRAREVAARLRGLKNARPRKLRTLQSSIASWFKPAPDGASVAAIVQQLSDAGLLTVTEGKVTYTLG